MRLKAIKNLTIALFFVLFIRLIQIQIVEHQKLLKESERNYIKALKISPVRGNIFDRNGIPIASYKPGFKISVIPAKLTKEEWALLEKALNLSPDLKDSLKGTGFITLKAGLTLEQVAYLEERSDKLPWVIISPTVLRNYPYGPLFFHPIGYIGLASKQEVSKEGYEPDDYTGKMGLERLLEDSLKGQKGYRFVALDVHGMLASVDPRAMIPPKMGKSFKTTLDIRLQAYADSLAKPYKRVAIVMLDLEDSGILVLYSKPEIDPNIFIKGLKRSEWLQILNDTLKPLLNRAISGLYPPGSTIKPIVGLMGLYTGVITPETRLKPCTGSFKYGNHTWLCWGVHGSLNLYGAITHSCDIYFYQLGLKIGLRRFLRLLNQLPIKKKWLNLKEEKTGFLPTLEWYKSRYGKYNVTEGLVLNLSIGQGEIALTPLELVYLTGLIAKGALPEPHILYGRKTELKEIPFASEKELEVIRKAMLFVVEKGTGQRAKIPGLKIAGKTGTAQNPHGRDHSLFVAFAPYKNPKVAISVIVENGGHGSEAAAPIAGKLIARYFKINGLLK